MWIRIKQIAKTMPDNFDLYMINGNKKKLPATTNTTFFMNRIGLCSTNCRFGPTRQRNNEDDDSVNVNDDDAVASLLSLLNLLLLLQLFIVVDGVMFVVIVLDNCRDWLLAIVGALFLILLYPSVCSMIIWACCSQFGLQKMCSLRNTKLWYLLYLPNGKIDNKEEKS